MSERTILDNAQSGARARTYLNGKRVLMWVTSGRAVIEHDGAPVCTLTVGERKVADGHYIGMEVWAQAYDNGTTLKFIDG